MSYFPKLNINSSTHHFCLTRFRKVMTDNLNKRLVAEKEGEKETPLLQTKIRKPNHRISSSQLFSCIYTLSNKQKMNPMHANSVTTHSFWLTSSDNVKTKEENDATHITTQPRLVRTIYCNHAWVTFFL